MSLYIILLILFTVITVLIILELVFKTFSRLFENHVSKNKHNSEFQEKEHNPLFRRIGTVFLGIVLFICIYMVVPMYMDLPCNFDNNSCRTTTGKVKSITDRKVYSDIEYYSSNTSYKTSYKVFTKDKETEIRYYPRSKIVKEAFDCGCE